MPVRDYESRFDLSGDAVGGNSENLSVRIKSVTVQGGDPLQLASPGVTLIVGGNNAGKSTLLRQMYQQVAAAWNSTEKPSPPLLGDQQLEVNGSLADAHAWLADNGHPGQRYVQLRGVEVYPSLLELVWSRLDTGRLDAFGQVISLAPNARSRFDATLPATRRPLFTDPPYENLHYLEDDPSLMDELSQHSQAIFGHRLTLDPLSGKLVLRFGTTTVEAPPVDQVTTHYRDALMRLKSVHEQGDGVASTLGLLIPLVASRNPLAFIDEPEAYLHPPQAFKLGQALAAIAKRRNSQLIIATHDRNFVAGILSQDDLEQTVIRLERSGDRARGHRVESSDLREVWSSALLRHSNILDGLFHRAVIIAEDERDCLFYTAALEAQSALPGNILPNDLLFISSHGKDGVAEVSSILTSAHVPVVAVLDLDALRDKAALRKTVISLGGDWSDQLDRDFDRATAEFRTSKKPWKNGQVLAAVRSVLEGDVAQEYGSEARRNVQNALSLENPWSEVKKYGINAFRADRLAAERTLAALAKQGVVLVRVGELENFAPALGVRKGPAWLSAALKANIHATDGAGEIARAIAESTLHREGLQT